MSRPPVQHVYHVLVQTPDGPLVAPRPTPTFPSGERFVYDCATKKGAFTTAAKARFCQRVDNLFALLRLSRRTHAGRPAPKRTRASDHPCSPCPCHNRL